MDAAMVRSSKWRPVIHSAHEMKACGIFAASKYVFVRPVLPVASSPCTIIAGGLGSDGYPNQRSPWTQQRHG